MNQNDTSSSSSSSSRKPVSISKKTTYKKRKKTLKKKAKELSILCGVPVGLICVEPTGKVETWPEDGQKIDEILRQYLRKTTTETMAFPFPMKNRNPNSAKKKYESWHPELDYLPEESLVEIVEYIERKEKILDERMLTEKTKKIRV